MKRSVVGTAFLVAAIVLESRALRAQAPNLVVDLRTGTESRDLSTEFFRGVALGDEAFLSLSGYQGGWTVWRTNGTASGTHLLVDAGYPFAAAGNPLIAASKGRLFMVGTDVLRGAEIWTSDGTPAGTRMVSDVATGSDLHFELIPFRGGALYVRDYGPSGPSLFFSDGTAAGTVRLVENPSGPGTRTIVGTLGDVAMLFAGSGLWRTDGTPEGTLEVLGGLGVSGPLTEVGAGGVFRATGSQGTRPWFTDGTTAGTFVLADVDVSGGFAGFAASAGGLAYFRGCDSEHGCELWSTDGTPAGTHLAADIAAGPPSSNPLHIFGLGSRVLFLANGTELWSFDGTTLVLLRAGLTLGLYPEFLSAGRTAYFAADDGASGVELWATDGTPEGTRRVVDLEAGPPGSRVQPLVAVSSTLFFVATTSASGTSFWATDGDEASTRLLKRLDVQPAGSYPSDLRRVSDGLVFTAYDSPSPFPRRLFRTDGTANGTFRLTVSPGAPTEVTGLMSVDANVACFASRGAANLEPWITDGTAAGTERLTGATEAPSTVFGFSRMGSRVLYTRSVESGSWLESTDRAGKAQVLSPVSSITAPYMSGLARFGPELFYTTGIDGPPSALRATDGTAAGTRVVVTAGNAGVAAFTSVAPRSGELVVMATSMTGNLEVWGSDGTATGTERRASVGPRMRVLDRATLTVGIWTFFLVGTAPGTEWTLYRTDGTQAGTVALTAWTDRAGLLSPLSLWAAGGRLFFAPQRDAIGAELWTSDGTPDGTVLVKDIRPGPASSWPREGADVNGLFYFYAHDGVAGLELWRSDGTEAGTSRVVDLNPGPASSGPSLFLSPTGYGSSSAPALIGTQSDRLVLIGNDGVTGEELHAIPAPRPATRFVPLTPCRLVDTRTTSSALEAGVPRRIPVTGVCGVPPDARSLAVNVTVVAPTSTGTLKAFAAGTVPPEAGTVSARPGRTRASQAFVAVGSDAAIALMWDARAGSSDAVVDVSGYFRAE